MNNSNSHQSLLQNTVIRAASLVVGEQQRVANDEAGTSGASPAAAPAPTTPTTPTLPTITKTGTPGLSTISPSIKHNITPATGSDSEDSGTITRLHSPINTPTILSRSTSPILKSSKLNNNRNQSRVGARAQREAAARAKLSSKDPLRRLPINAIVRIFTIVGLGLDGCGGNLDGSTFSAVKDLLNAGLVCKKWRDSPTINYVWYKLCKQNSYQDRIEKEFGPISWTRKDSKANWSEKYRRIHQTQSHQIENTISNPSQVDEDEDEDEDDGGRWTNSNDGRNLSKNEARAFYKELGGRKLKFKTAKGSGSERTGWEDREYFE